MQIQESGGYRGTDKSQRYGGNRLPLYLWLFSVPLYFPVVLPFVQDTAARGATEMSMVSVRLSMRCLPVRTGTGGIDRIFYGPRPSRVAIPAVFIESVS